jgi:hypothetical protein
VLSGEIELGTLAADHRVVEEPDLDTHIEWRPGLDLDGLMLSAFQVVHASALVEGDAMRRLPPEVVTLAAQLIATGRGALRRGASAIEQVQARADSEAHLTVEQLLRPTTAPELTPPRPTGRNARHTPSPPLLHSRLTRPEPGAPLEPLDDQPREWRLTSRSSARPQFPDLEHIPLPADVASFTSHELRADAPDDRLDAGDVLDAIDTSRVAAALERVAAAIAHLGDSDDLRRADQLVRLLRELAAVLSDEPGNTSPGTSAAARRAARGGLALSTTERARLRWALTSLDTPATWQPAIAELEALAEQLGAPHPDTASPTTRAPKPSTPPTSPRRTPRSPGHRSPRDGAAE